MAEMIYIAKDFSPYPAGRVDGDGQFNGTNFRENYLLPKLRKVVQNHNGGKLFVNIDNVRAFGSSFIDEAFAGLVRNHEVTKDDLIKYIEITCTQNDIIFFRDAIIDAIKNA